MSWHVDHPELLEVCDTRGEGDSVNYSINPDKLGTDLLVYDPTELETNQRNGVFRSVEWFRIAAADYNKIMHAHLRLCTVPLAPPILA